MSTTTAGRNLRSTGQMTAVAALFTALLAVISGGESTFAASRGEIELRERALRNSADATNQRTIQERDTAERQRQLLQYQIRKNKRMQLKMQCRAAGLPDC
jgi:hypothetical protein